MAVARRDAHVGCCGPGIHTDTARLHAGCQDRTAWCVNPTFRGGVRRTNSKGTLGIVDIMRSFTSSRAIARALRKAPQFAQLNDAQLAMLAYGGEERRVPRYTVLYREGSVAHSFYVLLSGRLQQSSFHSTQKQVLKAPAADKVEGVCLGTEGLSGNMRRLATATTLDECLILHFSTEGFHLDGEGLAGLAARASASVVTAALRGHSFFELLPEATLLDVAPLFRLEEVGQAGETVLQEGGPLDKMCLLLEGSVRLSIGGEDVGVLPDDGDEQEAIFGEAAVLSSAASVLSVVTRGALQIFDSAAVEVPPCPGAHARLERTAAWLQPSAHVIYRSNALSPRFNN